MLSIGWNSVFAEAEAKTKPIANENRHTENQCVKNAERASVFAIYRNWGQLSNLFLLNENASEAKRSNVCLAWIENSFMKSPKSTGHWFFLVLLAIREHMLWTLWKWIWSAIVCVCVRSALEYTEEKHMDMCCCWRRDRSNWSIYLFVHNDYHITENRWLNIWEDRASCWFTTFVIRRSSFASSHRKRPKMEWKRMVFECRQARSPDR